MSNQESRRAQPEGEAPQADVQAPSAAAIDDVVDNLREYADNAGYSHNDYQDTMRQAANTIEALRAQLWHWGPLAAQQAAAPGAPALLNTDELAALRRFYETCQDGEGYDVPKAMMQRLAEIGVVRRTSGSYYETTEFGLRVLHQPAPSAPGTPEAPQTAAARDVLAERQRQVDVEGWKVADDDGYKGGELSIAAACYALQGDAIDHIPAEAWPWPERWWKPAGARRNLVKAGALILADIERLDRAAQLDGGQGEAG